MSALLAEVRLDASAPGGMVDYRRALTARSEPFQNASLALLSFAAGWDILGAFRSSLSCLGSSGDVFRKEGGLSVCYFRLKSED